MLNKFKNSTPIQFRIDIGEVRGGGAAEFESLTEMHNLGGYPGFLGFFTDLVPKQPSWISRDLHRFFKVKVQNVGVHLDIPLFSTDLVQLCKEG